MRLHPSALILLPGGSRGRAPPPKAAAPHGTPALSPEPHTNRPKTPTTDPVLPEP